MDPMEIMIKTTGFRRLIANKRKKYTLFFSTKI